MKHRHGFALLVLLLGSECGRADELLMNNGSRLVGTLVSASQNYVVFDTPFAGEIKIRQDNIDVLVTDQPVTLMMADGAIYRDKQIVTRDEELLVTAQNQLPVIFDVAEIKLVNPEPWRLGDGYKWFGQFNSALASERGNTDTDELDVDFESVWRSLEDRYTVRGTWEIDEANGDKNKNSWMLRNKYDRFSTGDTDNYYGVQLALEKDEFADLDLRTTVGPYIGRQFYEGDHLTLHGEVGVVYVDEQFDLAQDDDFWGANWEMRLSSDIIPGATLYINSDGIVNFDDVDGVLVNTTVGVGLPIIFGFKASLEAIYEYDGGAVEDVDTLDETYNVKIGYSW